MRLRQSSFASIEIDESRNWPESYHVLADPARRSYLPSGARAGTSGKLEGPLEFALRSPAGCYVDNCKERNAQYGSNNDHHQRTLARPPLHRQQIYQHFFRAIPEVDARRGYISASARALA